MKLDKTYKDEVDQEFKETDYVGRKIGVRILVIFIALVILCGVGGVVYTKTIHKSQVNADREVFKDSLPYTEQAAQFLAKSYKEYNDTEDDTEKTSIMEYVAMKYPNLNMDSIDNVKLRNFYEKCIY